MTPQEYALQHLHPLHAGHGRLVIPSAQIDAVHAHFGTRAVDYLLEPDAIALGDAVSAVAALAGAWCVRVHDVGGSRDAVEVASAWSRG